MMGTNKYAEIPFFYVLLRTMNWPRTGREVEKGMGELNDDIVGISPELLKDSILSHRLHRGM